MNGSLGICIVRVIYGLLVRITARGADCQEVLGCPAFLAADGAHLAPHQAADELPALQARLGEELEQLGNYAESCSRLEQLAAEKRRTLDKLAAELTAQRQKAAANLARDITQNMATLGMGGGRFEVRIRPLADAAAGPDGADDIEFLVSANPGQPPTPSTSWPACGRSPRSLS